MAGGHGHTIMPVFKRAYSRALGHRGAGTSVAGEKTARITPGSITIGHGADQGSVKRGSLPNFWLRDNCRCNQCVNPSTSQRNFDTFAIPSDVAPANIETTPQGLKVLWNHGNHESFYPWDFLDFYQRNSARAPEPIDLKLWGSEIATDPPTVSFEEIMSNVADDAGVAKMTQLIRLYGMVFVEGTPHTAVATEELLRRIAFIRETHYGGFYDFIPDMAMADTAYTNIRLPAHTDTTYFSDPAGLQSFHILSHTGKDSKGGSSLLVDGFNAAAILKKEAPEAYDILTKVRLPWHASGNKGITIAPDQRYPVVETDPEGSLLRIRWNNDDRGVVPFKNGIEPDQWYQAARKWHEIITRSNIEYWRLLRPGTTLIFDNWRVMHGRSEFTGIRRVCGGYVNRDDFISRWRNTNYPRSDILDNIVG
ncbi:hypothetical protein BROUX41_000017 [Berkeleyomyces rouxiae]|uniref:uncharacterized protein n=1 Tax=Berkeleyomyces rouxiae TaxID=2035830 RepID=UPI003B7D7722